MLSGAWKLPEAFHLNVLIVSTKLWPFRKSKCCLFPIIFQTEAILMSKSYTALWQNQTTFCFASGMLIPWAAFPPLPFLLLPIWISLFSSFLFNLNPRKAIIVYFSFMKACHGSTGTWLSDPNSLIAFFPLLKLKILIYFQSFRLGHWSFRIRC